MATVPPLPPRCTEPLICHVSCGWVAGEHLSQTGNKAFLLSQGDRSAQVCLGGSGEGDGLLGPHPPPATAVLCISCWQPGARPVSLGAREGSEGSGIWVRLIGSQPLLERLGSDSGRPFEEGLPEHLCQVWHPGACCAPPPPSWKHTVVCGTGRSPPCSGEARPSQAAWPGLCQTSTGDSARRHGCPGDAGSEEGSQSASGVS